MQAQVLFKIDRAVKEKAMKRAQAQGLSFGTMLKLATSAYAMGELSVSLVPSNVRIVKPTKNDIIEIKRANENFAKGNYYTLNQVKRELGISN
jgi:hypothetical protein